MSISLSPVITSAGLTAALNEANTGIAGEITEIALGDTAWTPDSTATALQNELQRISVSGDRVGDHQLLITGFEQTDNDYWIREVGFYLSDGTLFGVWSSTERPLAYKSAGVDLALVIDLILTALPAGSINVTSGGFHLPHATTEQYGVIKVATDEQVNASADLPVAVTPKQVAERALSLGIPVGASFIVFGDTVLDGTVKASGASLNRSDFPALFAYAEQQTNYIDQATKDADYETYAGYYGDGDGSTTFTLPDARGEGLRVWDDGRGVDIGRGIGSWQDFAIENITAGGFVSGGYASPSGALAYSGGAQPEDFNGAENQRVADFDASRVVKTANETRGRSIAVMVLIKY